MGLVDGDTRPQKNFDEDLGKLCKRIGDKLADENTPMKDRFRALFTLRNLGGEAAIQAITRGFADSSALLKHECAYCLGQMVDPRAVDILIEVLCDTSQEPMVRHEAGEALGAIADERGIPYLEEFQDDPVVEVNSQTRRREVRYKFKLRFKSRLEEVARASRNLHLDVMVAETCQLALERLKWMKSNPQKLDRLTSQYHSVDPTPCSEEKDVSRLEAQLLDEKESLFNRYCAMFALRNLGTDDAVRALAKGLRAGGALFRHEVAYVLGQIQSSVCVKELADGLADEEQNPMVRHECADALGSLADEYGTKMLRKYLRDPERVVRESCEIGLDIADYEQSGDFQYANTIAQVLSSETVSSQ